MQEGPRGKIGLWISDFQEFDYIIRYIRGIDNVKADAFSRNSTASHDQPETESKAKVCSTYAKNKQFNEQLSSAQCQDLV